MSLFGKLTSVLRSAAEEFSEVLAPTHRAPIEDFKYNWKRITDYVFFMDQSGEMTPVEDTDIPSHLAAMVRRLEEEEISTPSEMGPCMEHLLRHHLLKTAVILGQGNFPPGMMREILRFHTKLLTQISQPLVPHIDVYSPLKTLMTTCKSKIGQNPQDDLELVNLLAAVCGKVVDDNSLVEFFIDQAAPTKDGSAEGSASFILVQSLLPLMFHEHDIIAQRAREALLVCLTVKSRHAANVIVQNTATCKSLADQLVKLFSRLPLQHEDYEQETLGKIAKWSDMRMDTWRAITAQQLAPLCPASQVFLQLMRMLLYCDEAACLSEPVIRLALSESLLRDFLVAAVGPRLNQRSEQVNVSATNCVTAMVTQLWSHELLNAFVEFLLGNSEQWDFQLRDLLIDRCNDMSNEVSLATLTLFQRLVESRNEECFVLLGFSGIKATAAVDSAADAGQDHLADTRVVVARLLAVLPTELKSCSSEDEQFTYREYLQDAQQQVQDCFEACRSWSGEGVQTLPQDGSFVAVAEVDDDGDGEKGSAAAGGGGSDGGSAGGAEGDEPEDVANASTTSQDDAVTSCRLLHVLLRRLRDLPSQSYSMNLCLTALLSSILQFPHQALQDFLLGSSPSSLMCTLEKVSADMQTKVGRIPNVEQRLAEVRLNLIDPSAGLAPSLTPEQVELLQAVIVLEEFCKELAAVILVKANALLLN